MAVVTQKQGDQHFGNLTVGTILDSIAVDDTDRTALVSLTVEKLVSFGADLVISNQSHAGMGQAYKRAGFRRGPSNYLFAASPKLAAAIGGTPVAGGRVYVTRADGDGRINL
jgi:hypothetical protein